ncbi:MAG: purine-nucleoside phosphorylase [Bosea sp. (in: a-proteobacteria)]
MTAKTADAPELAHPDLAIDKAEKFLRSFGLSGTLDLAMVLGTGLGKIADDLEDAITIPFADIPGFPATHGAGVSGHERMLRFGRLEGRRVLILQGRGHYYEAGDAAIMRCALGTIARFGAPPLLLTNAAGSTRAEVKPGAMVLLSDHINFGGPNPLIGETGDRRFTPMTEAYDQRLRYRIKNAAQATGIALHEGVYMWFTGPSFETPAEIRMARTLGADLVGMSTVPEVILARFFGLRVAAISTVTNLAAGIMGANPSHEETRDVAGSASVGLRRIIRAFVAGLHNDS